jgi:proton glutamate symport protein
VTTATTPRFAATAFALSALALGLGGGALLHAVDPAAAPAVIGVLEPIGTLWTHALRMVVLPLVIANLVVGIAGTADTRAVGRLVALSLALFVSLIALASGFTLLTGPWLLTWFHVDPATTAALARQGATAAPDSGAGFSFATWLVGLIPVNPFRAATSDEILPLLIFTAMFALSLGSIAPDPRRRLLEMFRALAAAMSVLLRWVLRVMPVGVFCLTFVLAARAGTASISAIGFFIVFVCVLLVTYMLLLYPIAAVGGRVPLGRFAWAAVPAQMVAIGTRSSLAALPSMIEGAEQRLGLAPEVTSLVLPLSVSTFKVNQAISSAAQLLFLAKLYGVHLDPWHILAFVVTTALTSFSTAGVPSTGSHSSLPAYVAAGIPLEGVMILGAVDTIPDIFKTLLNVTGDLTVTAIVARFAPRRAAS